MWISGAALLRALLSGLVPLLPDETYYWSWTTRLEPGYFDHPPGIALLISLGTLLFGDTTTGVRAGPAIAALITHTAAVSAAWYSAGKGTVGALAARRSAVLFTVVPLATLGLVLATPDAALFAAAMCALLAVDRALSAPVRSWSAFRWWIAAGVGLGGAFVSKYTAVLLPAGLVLACVVHPALRARFREAGPWWAALVAVLLFAPVLAWNASHDWISFRFQINHGLGAVARGSVLSRELELVGGQMGLVSPILFVVMALTVWWALRDGWKTRTASQPTDVSTRRFAMAVVTLTPLVFFAVSATRKPVEANWPALIYPSALLLLATDTRLTVPNGALARWWKRGVALAVVLLGIVAVQAWQPILPLAPRKDPIARAHGWESLAKAVDAARHDVFFEGEPVTWIAADRYQDASELWFHLLGQPRVFSLNLGGRPNHYDLWDTFFDVAKPGDALIALFDDNPAGEELGAQVGRWFRWSSPAERVILRRGSGEIAHRRIWLYRSATEIPLRPNASRALSSKP